MTSLNHSPARDEPSTHVSLLLRAQAGSGDGWAMLVQVYGPIVYRWIRGCGIQPADAADVMQETFLAVMGALPRFDVTVANSTFRGWLWTIARNKLRDRQRRQAAVKIIDGSEAARLMDAASDNLVDQDDPPSSFDDDVTLARSQALELLRTSFDARSWRMFWDTAIVGRAASDVAEEMGVSPWAVYKAKSRVLQRLRCELDGF